MDTESFIPVNNKETIEELRIADIDDIEENIFTFHIELTRHIQESRQLFLIFRFNLESLLNSYTLKAEDRIIRRKNLSSDISDFISINALVINYISSGKTLIDSLEICMKHNFGEDSEGYLNFKNNYLRKTYDEYFGYRFLTRLRDYSQHGHLPISLMANRCSFDLNQIFYTPHFNHNKTIEKEMENIKNEILIKYGNRPCISFTLTLAQYNLGVTLIYKSFLDSIKHLLVESNKKLNSLLRARPDIINHGNGFEGLVFYTIKNDNIHAFNSNDDSMHMFDGYENEAKLVFKEEQAEYLKIISQSL